MVWVALGCLDNYLSFDLVFFSVLSFPFLHWTVLVWVSFGSIVYWWPGIGHMSSIMHQSAKWPSRLAHSKLAWLQLSLQDCMSSLAFLVVKKTEVYGTSLCMTAAFPPSVFRGEEKVFCILS